MLKRGNNEGSIYRTSDGRWRGAVSLGYKDGKPIRKVFSGKTRQEVSAKLTKAISEHAAGVLAPPDRQTVGQFLTRWLADCVTPSVRAKTLRSYEQMVRVHLVPSIGKIPLSRLSPQHLQRFLNAKLQAGKSPRLVAYLRAVLRIALNQAVQWGVVPRNVAKLVKPPLVPRKEVEPFTPEEARRFLAAVQGHRLEALFTTVLALGLRQGEALALSLRDLNLEEATLAVRHTLQRINRQLTRVETKSKQSRRLLALPEVCEAALREHLVRRELERAFAGEDWEETEYLFTTRIGTPLDARNVLREFNAIVARAGLPKRRFHDLRHTCATLLLVQGVHPRVVMDLLGHSQIRLTMDTYSHVVRELAREAATKMNAILEPVATSVATTRLQRRNR